MKQATFWASSIIDPLIDEILKANHVTYTSSSVNNPIRLKYIYKLQAVARKKIKKGKP